MRGAALAAAVLAAGCAGAPPPLAPYTIAEGDVQVAPTRRADHTTALAGYEIKLWANGVVRYYIDTQRTNPFNPSEHLLAANDTAILSAIDEWATRTCVRFVRCTRLGDCVRPFVRFVSDRSACSSPLGVAANGINQINVARECGFGGVLHEIGHTLGLAHEVSRFDRDSYVCVNDAHIDASARDNFAPLSNGGLTLGGYDFDSVMHYGTHAFATGSLPSVLTPRFIGRRSHLSPGDCYATDFIYNSCSSVFARPRCAVSLNASVTNLIPHGTSTTVAFSALYNSFMTVSYAPCTAPSDTLRFDVSEGGVLGSAGRTFITFTPTALLASQVFTLAVAFTGGDGTVSTCGVNITVADAPYLCFGYAPDDPRVCSGHGVCIDDPCRRCVCRGGYGGAMCEAYATCARNALISFDNFDITVRYEISGAVARDEQRTARGLASLAIGDPDDSNPRASQQATQSHGGYRIHTADVAQPKRLLFAAAGMPGGTALISVGLSLRQCLTFSYESGVWHYGKKTLRVYARPRVFHWFDIRVDWAAQTVTIFIDGVLEMRDAPFGAECTSMDQFSVQGRLWVDELGFLCTDHITSDGTVDALDPFAVQRGGAYLTLDVDTCCHAWADTPGMRRGVLDALRGVGVPDAHPSSFASFRARFLANATVAVDNTTLTIGPLGALPDYRLDVPQRIVFTPTPAMFNATGGASAAALLDGRSLWEVGWVLPGRCAETYLMSFDTAADFRPRAGMQISTAEAQVGGGCLELTGRVLHELSVGCMQPSSIAFYAKVASATVNLRVSFIDNTGRNAFRILVGYKGMVALQVRDAEPVHLAWLHAVLGWNRVDVAVDWAAVGGVGHSASITLTGVFKQRFHLDASATCITRAVLSADMGTAYVDELYMRCPQRRSFLQHVTPPCPDPAEGVVFEVSVADAPEAVLRVVDADDAACANPFLEEDVPALDLATPGWRGTNHLAWRAPPLARLSPGAAYSLCLHNPAANTSQHLGAFATCRTGSRDTALPATAIPTPAHRPTFFSTGPPGSGAASARAPLSAASLFFVALLTATLLSAL